MIISMSEREFKKYIKKDRIKQPLTDFCEEMGRVVHASMLSPFEIDKVKMLIKTFQVKLDL